MDNTTWGEFLKLHEPYCRISNCDIDDLDLTVDHIIPRWQGGTDDLSNLQWAHGRCNSSKGPRPDPYWSRAFYWDNQINLAALRVYQRSSIWDAVLDYADAAGNHTWLTRPWSAISRRLYTCAAAVGSGKTLAMATLAFALNHVIRRDHGQATPRVSQMLILTKEIGLRDQIADDLRCDLLTYGICDKAPRVRTVERGEVLLNPEALATADVWVACTAMLYENSGQPRRDLARILAHFPLICIDEPHWALEQVLNIVDAASTSLCFGFTGTPITAKGEAIQRFVLFSLYDYQSAVTYDHSLKYQ
jgi:hypothetical protein